MMRGSLFLPAPSFGGILLHWLKSTGMVVVLSSAVSAGAFVSIALPEHSAMDHGAESIVEFAPVVTSAESDASVAAPMSEAEDRPATSDLNEVQSKKVEHELPTEQASPVAPEDDLRMAQERTQKENEQADADVQATEAMDAQSESASSQSAAAADASEAAEGLPESEVATAPDLGNSTAGQRRIAEWQRRLFGHIAKHKTYPEAARQKRATGEAMVAFRIGRDGRLSELRILKTSGHDILDRTALDVMRRASPLPSLPSELKGESFDFSLPMRFTLK